MSPLLIVFECNASDVAAVLYGEHLAAGQLLVQAQEIARDKETDICNITMRFTWINGEEAQVNTRYESNDVQL